MRVFYHVVAEDQGGEGQLVLHPLPCAGFVHAQLGYQTVDRIVDLLLGLGDVVHRQHGGAACGVDHDAVLCLGRIYKVTFRLCGFSCLCGTGALSRLSHALREQPLDLLQRLNRLLQNLRRLGGLIQIAVILADLGDDVLDPGLDFLPEAAVGVGQLREHLAVGQHQLHALGHQLLAGHGVGFGHGHGVLDDAQPLEGCQLVGDGGLGIHAHLLQHEVGQNLELLGRPLLDVVGDLMPEGVQGYVLAVSQGVDIDVDGVVSAFVVAVGFLALLGEDLGLDDDIRSQHLGQHLGGLVGGVLLVRELLDVQTLATHHGALLACLCGGLFLCLGLFLGGLALGLLGLPTEFHGRLSGFGAHAGQGRRLVYVESVPPVDVCAV